jgi:methionyl-tRNA formyltransferase
VSDRPIRTVFLGSGEFALPTVEMLAQRPELELIGVVTVPPRPVGRRQELQATPVGAWADQRGVPVLMPRRLRDPDAVEAMAALLPELLVLADYGQIVPPEVLELPRLGPLNVHPSLLPRHRGAAPIQAAIMAGDRLTGVTLMVMDAGLDSGPIVAQRELALDGTETSPRLELALADLGATLLAETVPAWLDGSITPRPQPGEGVTLTRPLRRQDGRLDPSRAATELERQVRAYQPWPGSFLDTPQGRLIVWRARATDDSDGADPGALVTTPAGEPALVAGQGLLELLEVQPAGGRRMSGRDLVRGRPGLVPLR